MSEPMSPRRARRAVAVGFVAVATVAALVAPTWLALHDRDTTNVAGTVVAPPPTVSASPTQAPTLAATPSPTSTPDAGLKVGATQPGVAASTTAGAESDAVTAKGALASDANNPAGSVAALAADHWRTLPAAPIEGRTDAAVGWTGTAMVVWGGLSGNNDQVLHADGAAYDPSSQTWTTLPPGPLTARSDAASVWTGTALFVWGGDDRLGAAPQAASDGALYYPATKAWRRLPPSPLSARTGAQALLLGGLVYVVGGQPATDPQHGDVDAASYDPATNRWKLLPAIPAVAGHSTWGELATATHDELYVWSLWEHTTTSGNDTSMDAGIDAASYDPGTQAWTTQPRAAAGATVVGAPNGMTGVISTSAGIVSPASQLWCGDCPAPFATGTHGYLLAPGSSGWTPLPHSVIDDDNPSYLWTGSALLAYNSTAYTTGGPDGTRLPGGNAAWDPTSNTWTSLPAAPLAGSGDIAAVWTGSQLLEWGPMMDPTTLAGGGSPAVHDAGLSFAP